MASTLSPVVQRLTDEEIQDMLNTSIRNEEEGEEDDDLFEGEVTEEEEGEYEVMENTETESEIDSDTENEGLDISIEESSEYRSKDNTILWRTTPPNRNQLTPAENIIRGRMGVTSFAVQRITELKDSFNLCFTDSMKRDVIHFSNLEGNRIIENFEEIDMVEFDAFLGVLLLIGVYRSYGESVRSLWDEVHGRPIFRAVMRLNRYSEISRVLSFDDRQARRLRGTRGDKLEPIRDLYDKWYENLDYLYVPKESITVGEQLIPFRGRCPFKVYMPSKPGKYGMKAWIAADSSNGFCLKFQIYLGRNRNEPAERNQGERVVLDLISSAYAGRSVITDNFFTTHNLASELLKRKVTIIGTVRQNRKFLPVHATARQLRRLPVHSSTFFFDNKVTIVRYVPKKYKLVTLLSTLHHDQNIRNEHPKKIPKIIEYYNFTKGGVDQLDQLVRTYTCKRQTQRWPVALFSNLIDISALNAYILWTEIHPQWNSNKTYKRRLYLKQLGEALVRPCIVRRNRLPRAAASADTVRNIQAEEEEPSTSTQPPAKKKANERKRCKFCPPFQAKKTFTECEVCHEPVCPYHRYTTTITHTYCEQHVP